MANIRHESCPLCSGKNISEALTNFDGTVLQKPFVIWHCSDCTAKFTQDGPDETDIGDAYASADYISHSNVSRGIVNRLYHFARQISLRQKRRWVHELSAKKGGRLVEVGSGRGHFLSTMQKFGWNATGYEASTGARSAATAEFAVDIRAPETLSEEPTGSVDIVALWHVLEHLHQIHVSMDTFRRILTSDGLLLIAVPNHLSNDAKFYGSDWAAWDAPRHLYHFTSAAIEKLASKHGFEVVARRGMGFDPFYISLLSEKNRHGRTRLVPGFYRGLISFVKAWGRPESSSSIIFGLRKSG